MVAFARLSLSRQFLLISFPILLAGMLIIGALIGRQVERSVVHRIGSVTGLYVDSFVEPHVQNLMQADDITAQDRAALSALLGSTALGEKIVSFKVWRPDGRILYSRDPALIGRAYPIKKGLAEAGGGNVHSQIRHMKGAENASELQKWPRLIETYAPLHAAGVGTVIAIAEFYQTVDEVTDEAWAAQRQSWIVVASTTLMMYLLLFLLVRQGSRTIDDQRRELHAKLGELTALNEKNEMLHDRVRRAAASTTALNESYLRRISADLHDGPGQDLGFALMRFEAVSDHCAACDGSNAVRIAASGEFGAIRAALQSALADLRAISAGLLLPDIDSLSASEVAQRAVRDYVSKTGAKATLSTAGGERTASLPVKIPLYRPAQKTPAKGSPPAPNPTTHAAVPHAGERLQVEVSDDGPGFDPAAVPREGHLGLVGMRERAEVLGGAFALHSVPGGGTVIQVSLPLFVPEASYE